MSELIDAIDAHRSFEEIQALLTKEGELENKDVQGRTAMHHAVTNGNIQLVRYLATEHPQLLNTEDRENWTPLMLAIHIGNIDMFNTVMELQPNLDLQTLTGHTALHFAVRMPQLHMAEKLFTFGADLNIVANHGYTVLHALTRVLATAIEYGTDLANNAWELVSFLINNGATPQSTADDGTNPETCLYAIDPVYGEYYCQLAGQTEHTSE